MAVVQDQIAQSLSAGAWHAEVHAGARDDDQRELRDAVMRPTWFPGVHGTATLMWVTRDDDRRQEIHAERRAITAVIEGAKR